SIVRIAPLSRRKSSRPPSDRPYASTATRNAALGQQFTSTSDEVSSGAAHAIKRAPQSRYTETRCRNEALPARRRSGSAGRAHGDPDPYFRTHPIHGGRRLLSGRDRTALPRALQGHRRRRGPGGATVAQLLARGARSSRLVAGNARWQADRA